ncbi:pilus assembly protein [Nocardioidaceae bacterium]|nr:pilus assembly protein [Nocardioidaceae bacterium]
MRRTPRREESGVAVVDFVLVAAVLVPLVLGLIQLGLVLHVRNTLTSAASEGARVAAAYDRGPVDAEARVRSRLSGVLGGDLGTSISVSPTTVAGAQAWSVEVSATVPPLGIGSVGIPVSGNARAIEEVLP